MKTSTWLNIGGYMFIIIAIVRIFWGGDDINNAIAKAALLIVINMYFIGSYFAQYMEKRDAKSR